MVNKVIDVASYQGSSIAYFARFKKLGATGVMAKLTEGTSYVNPKGRAQVTNALSVFGQVGVYHFFHGHGAAEARYFLKQVKALGLDHSTVLCIDVEANDLPKNCTPQINVFLQTLKAHGYPNVVTYASASWFNSGRINRSRLVDESIWVASYGTSQPGVAKVDAWQYTNNFHGVDCSYDYNGVLTVHQPRYYRTKGLYEVTTGVIHAYNDRKLTSKRYVKLTKGSRFYATPVKVGSVTRLKTKIGYFSGNHEFVKLVKAVK